METTATVNWLLTTLRGCGSRSRRRLVWAPRATRDAGNGQQLELEQPGDLTGAC